MEEIEIDLDGVIDKENNLQYIGKALKVDGVWRCTANIDGHIKLVEVTLTPITSHSIITCSFCGLGEEYDRVLISGPNVYICNECIETAQECVDDIIEDRKQNSRIKNLTVSLCNAIQSIL